MRAKERLLFHSKGKGVTLDYDSLLFKLLEIKTSLSPEGTVIKVGKVVSSKIEDVFEFLPQYLRRYFVLLLAEATGLKHLRSTLKPQIWRNI